MQHHTKKSFIIRHKISYHHWLLHDKITVRLSAEMRIVSATKQRRAATDGHSSLLYYCVGRPVTCQERDTPAGAMRVKKCHMAIPPDTETLSECFVPS